MYNYKFEHYVYYSGFMKFPNFHNLYNPPKFKNSVLKDK